MSDSINIVVFISISFFALLLLLPHCHSCHFTIKLFATIYVSFYKDAENALKERTTSNLFRKLYKNIKYKEKQEKK